MPKKLARFHAAFGARLAIFTTALAAVACTQETGSADDLDGAVDGADGPDGGKIGSDAKSDAIGSDGGVVDPIDTGGGGFDSGTHDGGPVDAPPGSDATPPPDATTPPPASGTDYAPYFFTWEWGGGGSGKFSSLVDLHDKHGLTGATIAFALADGGKCAATREVFDHLADAKAFMAKGGQLKVSFGGASGDYLDYICTDSNSFAKAIEDFVDGTGVTDLDFDIEQGSKSFNATVDSRRAVALKKVQDERKAVKISFTLAAAPSSGDGSGGLTSEGIGLLKAVLSKGVVVSHVNLMLMDYGGGFAGKPLAPPSIGSLKDANAQLRGLISGLTEAQAYQMLGATPMIGVNDDSSTFSLADAKSLTDFVKLQKIGLVAFWGINRDYVCTAGKDTCSMVDVKDFDFHNILKAVH